MFFVLFCFLQISVILFCVCSQFVIFTTISLCVSLVWNLSRLLQFGSDPQSFITHWLRAVWMCLHSKLVIFYCTVFEADTLRINTLHSPCNTVYQQVEHQAWNILYTTHLYNLATVTYVVVPFQSISKYFAHNFSIFAGQVQCFF